MESLVINYPGKEFVEIQRDAENKPKKILFRGCFEFTQLMNQFKIKFGPDISGWPLPQGSSHSEMIIREFLLKLKGDWIYPDLQEEICHCRHVSVSAIDEAIFNGAHAADLISQWTGASTACGTCRPEVEKLLAKRLGANTAAD